MTVGLAEGGELRRLEDAITIGDTLRQCWFRGHSRIVGALSPGAHREPFCSARENIEFWAGQRFRLRAPAYATDVPSWDDHVSWLLLAQHYMVPTRLLDWTENVLVGLCFAVCDDEGLDGELPQRIELAKRRLARVFPRYASDPGISPQGRSLSKEIWALR